MLKLHQDETCDAIIRHLERREGKARHDVHVRDIGNHTSPDARVEMTFRLGDQLYAIEHTGIEPFEGFLQHQNREPLFGPLVTSITAAIGSLLAPGVVIEMRMPSDAFIDRKSSEVCALHEAITPWVVATAPTLPRGADDRGTPISAQLPDVPFPVSLVRFDKSGKPPGRFTIKHLDSGSEEPRELRIKRACECKFPKLDIWKRSHGARTVLILENNDGQLTDIGPVAKTLLHVAKARDDCPDETYMVSTCDLPWRAWSILVNGRSHFDDPVHFEIEPSKA
jgi:hypothetical protein